MSPIGYEVTRGCNQQTQHWRGQLRGFAVTRTPITCVRVRACAGARLHACVCVCRVTAKPRNSLGVARVSRLRVRATA